MDLTTTIIGLVITALCVFPLVYMHWSQKKDRQKFLAEFLHLATQQQVVVTQHEVWGNYFGLGLDTKANKLFYYKKRGDKEQKTVINLAEVERCSVLNVKKALNNDQVIDRLELVFTIRNPRAGEKTLEFFSRDEFMTLSGELQLIEKWKVLINTHLESSKKVAFTS